MDPSKQFEIKMKALYKDYLHHCAEDGILLPMPYPQFRERVQEHMAKDLAHKIGKKDLAEAEAAGNDQDALYVAMRVADISTPVTDSKIMTCGQCGESVWVDPSMANMRNIAKAIICNQCLPEVTGHTREEIIKDKLEDL